MTHSKDLIDISPKISADLAVYPGDTPFKRTIDLDFERGDSYQLSHIESGVHLGAHTDAPSHYHPQGQDIAQRSLSFYYGDCQVIQVKLERGKRIYPAHIDLQKINAPRVLFKTNSFPDPNLWNDDFNSLSPELIHALAQKKVILVGIDTPSVDPSLDQKLPSHQAIYECDMAILEGIVLEHVKEGDYTLIALPLKIAASDASPVRAVLQTRDSHA